MRSYIPVFSLFDFGGPTEVLITSSAEAMPGVVRKITAIA